MQRTSLLFILKEKDVKTLRKIVTAKFLALALVAGVVLMKPALLYASEGEGGDYFGCVEQILDAIGGGQK